MLSLRPLALLTSSVLTEQMSLQCLYFAMQSLGSVLAFRQLWKLAKHFRGQIGDNSASPCSIFKPAGVAGAGAATVGVVDAGGQLRGGGFAKVLREPVEGLTIVTKVDVTSNWLKPEVTLARLRSPKMLDASVILELLLLS